MSDDPSQTKLLPDGPAGELPPGAELSGGMYRVTKRIAAGGFGITYEARDNLDRKVAIKECFPAGLALRAGDFTVSAASASTTEPFETARNLFLREARTLASLRHPNIVHVQTLFEENGTAYMAMDYIDGRDLQDVIDKSPELLTPAYVMELTRSILGALDYLHRDVPEKGKERLLHRDIKPANIRIDPLDTPVIIDFGAARQETKNRSRAAGTFRVVSDGYSPNEFYVAGTEQGPASDLYSLAATLHHCITGAAPAPADERAQKVSNGEEDPYQPIAGRFPGHDPRLLELIDRAMARPLKDRPADAAAWFAAIPDSATRIVEPSVAAAATVAAAGPASAAEPESAPSKPANTNGGFWKGAAVGGVVLALLGGGAVALAPDLLPGGSGDEGSLREVRRQLDEAVTRAAGLEEELSDATETAASLAMDVEAANEARDLAQARADELGDTVRDLREQIDVATRNGGPDVAELQDLLDRARADEQTALAAQRALEAQVSDLEGQLAAIGNANPGPDEPQVERLIQARDEALARAETAEAEIAELEEQIATLDPTAPNVGTATELQALRVEREAAIAARDAAISARDSARLQAERAQSDLQRMAADLDEAEQEYRRLSNELREAEARIALLEANGTAPNPGPNEPVLRPAPASGTTAGCPTWAVPGTVVSYTGTDIYAPQTHTTQAGGVTALSGCENLPFNVTGFVNSAPDFTFQLSEMEQFRRLQFEVAAECDATLLVNTQDTVWHFDNDTNGGNLPILNLTGAEAIEGRVDVWVGTADGSSCDATLEIETWLN